MQAFHGLEFAGKTILLMSCIFNATAFSGNMLAYSPIVWVAKAIRMRTQRTGTDGNKPKQNDFSECLETKWTPCREIVL